jgi:class 3 adenylate cyclase
VRHGREGASPLDSSGPAVASTSSLSWHGLRLLATFDGPARAVRCANAIIDAARGLGLELRAGLHTGEVELRGEDVSGLAVHIGARISALAAAGEVLVSGTVRDLVVGSGLQFEERGDHELRGIEGHWRLLAVRS